jgi:DNA-binding Xre family transcriptional regulator
MLNFNPKNVFSMRGIEKTTSFLVGRLGMDYSTASRFLKSKSQFVKIKDIEKLCIALEKRKETKNLQELVKDIPSNKLALIEQLLNELKA